MIKLYEDRKISNSKTVVRQLLDFATYHLQEDPKKKKIDENHNHLVEKSKDGPTASETQRKTKKGNKAARTIQKKKITGRLRLEATVTDKAFENKMTRIKVVPKGSGDLMVTDLEAGLARAYFMAKRKIKMKDFKIHAGISTSFLIKMTMEKLRRLTTQLKPTRMLRRGKCLRSCLVFREG